MTAGVIDELCAGTDCFFLSSETGWVKPLLLYEKRRKKEKACSSSADITITVWLLFIGTVTPPVSCAAVPPRGPTAVRRSIHRLSVPSHRRPLPPCAATPALNGESPSAGEAQRLRGFREAEAGSGEPPPPAAPIA